MARPKVYATPLQKWIWDNSPGAVEWLSKRGTIPVNTILQWSRGVRRPAYRRAKLIERLTGGAVKAKELQAACLTKGQALKRAKAAREERLELEKRLLESGD